MPDLSLVTSMPVVSVPTADGPIVKLANSHLRQSIDSLLAGIDPGHGNVQLTVTDGPNGPVAGVALATRLKIGGPIQWGVVVAASYDWQTKRPDYQVALNGSF